MISENDVIEYMKSHPESFTGLKTPNFNMPGLVGLHPDTIVAFMLNDRLFYVDEPEPCDTCLGIEAVNHNEEGE